MFRACSISKQFVCLLIRQLEQEGRITLDSHPSAYLPALAGFPSSLTIHHLCQNRSGLRDYWCIAMLTGAKAESHYSLEDGASLIRSLSEPMFAPGQQYSYSNGNWRILEWIIESITCRTVPDLLAERVFGPLGMSSSGWGSDTSLELRGNPRGYRANDAGWEEEITRACWSADAALVTTMTDYLRWEAAMLKADTHSLPASDSLGEAMAHADGQRGSYAFGINAWKQGKRWMHWHSGALRGWRMVQMRFPQDKIAIVVMLNRTENPMPVALKIAECIGVKTTWDEVVAQPVSTLRNIGSAYYSVALDLLAELRDVEGSISLSLGGEFVPLVWTRDNALANASGFCSVICSDAALDIHERQFGWRGWFKRLHQRDDRACLGGMRFRSALLGSTIAFADDGCTLHICGPAGQSDVFAVRPVGEGMVAFDCDRALDETPPGRFTVRINEDRQSIVVGCYLARGLAFVKL